jgi:hypothetical protein
MDVSALSALTSAGEAAQARDEASAGVLKKSMATEQAVALQLIEALSVPGLGENVNVLA